MRTRISGVDGTDKRLSGIQRDDAIRARSKVWLERDGQVMLSEWRVALLQAVDATGSLMRAAEALGVPYRTAWYKIKELEENWGIALLQTQSGGADGGGSRLTDEGRQLVERFQRITAGISTVVEERFRAEFDDILA